MTQKHGLFMTLARLKVLGKFDLECDQYFCCDIGRGEPSSLNLGMKVKVASHISRAIEPVPLFPEKNEAIFWRSEFLKIHYFGAFNQAGGTQ